MPSPLAGHYLVWAENGMAGKSVEHVLGELVHATDALGDHGSANPFAALNAALAATEPGANGVLFLPWLTGSFSPHADRSVRGGFLNLSLDARRIDLVRAAVEGTAHNLRWLLPFVEAFAGRAGDRIVFGGGAARSGMWAQIVADVLERPVDTLKAPGPRGRPAPPASSACSGSARSRPATSPSWSRSAPPTSPTRRPPTSTPIVRPSSKPPSTRCARSTRPSTR